MNKTYCLSIENLYNQNKVVLDNGYIIQHITYDNDSMQYYGDYYDLYSLNHEMICRDGAECKLIKKDNKGYYLHDVNDTNENSFFILTEEEFSIATFTFDVN